VTVDTSYVYNIKTITRYTKQIDNTKDKWIGDNNSNLEKANIAYIKRSLKL